MKKREKACLPMRGGLAAEVVKREHHAGFADFEPGSQCQNLAVAVSCVPYWLDSPVGRDRHWKERDYQIVYKILIRLQNHILLGDLSPEPIHLFLQKLTKGLMDPRTPAETGGAPFTRVGQRTPDSESSLE